MPTSVPTKFFKSLVLLLEVPQSEYLDVPKCDDPLNEQSRNRFFKMLRGGSSNKPNFVKNPKKQYSCNFSVAAWMSFNSSPTRPVALILSYRDSKGEFSIVVDETNPDGGTSLMLSGEVTIDYFGGLKYLRASCSGISKTHGFFLDEVHVNKVSSEETKAMGSASIAS